MPTEKELPLYRCHKEVRALKIASVVWKHVDGILAGATITPADAGYAPFDVDGAYTSKHVPEVGGYYVLYADGYKSYSPRKPFEEGYTLVAKPGPVPPKLDAKFYGVLRKVKDDSIVPDDMWMTFLVKDAAFLATLMFYRAECEELGADAEHLAAVDRTINRVTAWQVANQKRMKVPDAAGEKLLG